MKQIIKKLMSMPYYPNSKGEHEYAVEKILQSQGFKKISIQDINLTKSDILIDVKTSDPTYIDFPGKFYISQPCGSQSPPDFILIKDNNIIYLECKSCSKGGTPTWNTSLPKPNIIYLICSKKYNKATMFLGKDVISPDLYDVYEKHISNMKKEVELLNKELEQHSDNHHGWSYYLRNMFQQMGKNKNWFTHKNRDQYEKNVGNFIKNVFKRN